IKVSDQQTMEFYGTDLELSLWTRIEAQVEDAGSTTVSAKKLLEIVRELPQSTIGLQTLPNNKLLVQAGRSRFELATIPAEDFPLINFYEDVEFTPCDVPTLRKSLNKTLYGVPAEEDPFTIAGLFWHPLDAESFRFVSSDGHRLAYYEFPTEALQNLNIGKGLIIPRKGVQEILRIFEKEEEASVGIHENSLVLKTPSALLSIQLLEAEFPEYQMIIPDERPNALAVDSDSLYHALKRVAVLTNQKWRHVRFIISNGTLELEAGSPELGSANDSLDVDYSGEDFTIAFNIRYVMEAIQAIDSPQVRFEWVDQYHGGVFVGSDDPGYLSLIMPMVV
ncbi:MAG: DNA polymerase III subunit beta, partial [Acidobacteriota bacterium]